MFNLYSEFSLTANWTKPKEFVYSTKVGEIEIKLLGLMSENTKTGEKASASAGSIHDDPAKKAYFELLERTSAIDAKNSTSVEFVAYNSSKKLVRKLKTTDVFPKEPSQAKWKYSVSNGIAAHTTWENAAESAKLELIERDLVLKSWYGIQEPEHILDYSQKYRELCNAISNEYKLTAYLLAEEHPYKAVGVFGFPLKENNPFFYGFSADKNLQVATEKAQAEAIQRLGFLWGEEIPNTSPEYSPTSLYHQEYYLYPKSSLYIKRWLNGRFFEDKQKLKLDSYPDIVIYVDLVDTSSLNENKYFVVKALSENRMKLRFGNYTPKEITNRPKGKSVIIHPIA